MRQSQRDGEGGGKGRGNLTKRLLLFAIFFFGGLFLEHFAQIKINLMFLFFDKAFFPPISYMRIYAGKHLEHKQETASSMVQPSQVVVAVSISACDSVSLHVGRKFN